MVFTASCMVKVDTGLLESILHGCIVYGGGWYSVVRLIWNHSPIVGGLKF